ncbi:tRNA 2-selenouridine(34) synthase MnmH [Leptolyngbya sp. FACHB-711]|uniref:tRNA 2-selenouridine(34) synthase MnmH n=1 Tax=unclassified Leptolyngbya TaxID=2650499 RepID=UPI001F54871A|nr:tRNA 2-selenouridine(34) synthase MnmH [Leptolyngbya sp. FACHB-711]
MPHFRPLSQTRYTGKCTLRVLVWLLMQGLNAIDFLAHPGVMLDVRSPAEYRQGHIPGAISFPLFTDQERAQVGTCYKHEGRDAAVELGFQLVGPKSAQFLATAKQLAPDRRVRVHCWRGGMRSGSVAWVLKMGGFEVATLHGGYKAFRNWALKTFEQPKPIVILGGMTGTGKTDILLALKNQGAQVLDLEAIASHRGSSYGSLGLPPQPTNEQFENEAAVQWAKFQADSPIWIEAESKRIGTCCIPEPLFQQMDQAEVLEVVRPRSERLALLANVYGSADREAVVTATERIRKRLGGLRTQQAVDFIRQGQISEGVSIVLEYYDKTYTYDLQRRDVVIHPTDVAGLSAEESAAKLLVAVQQLQAKSEPMLSAKVKANV